MNKIINTKRAVLTALFTAIICVTTAFIFHIPTGINGGYIHIGDAFIYLAACVLPTPYAMLAASLGGGLADILSGSILWVIPTIIIKPILVLFFKRINGKIFNKRNIFGTIFAGVVGLFGYYLADVVFSGSFIAPLLTLPIGCIQPIGSGIIFLIIASAFDRIKLTDRLLQESENL